MKSLTHCNNFLIPIINVHIFLRVNQQQNNKNLPPRAYLPLLGLRKKLFVTLLENRNAKILALLKANI